MPPIAVTPSTELYTIGRGILYIAEIVAGAVGSYSNVGNVVNFSYQPTEQSIEHFCSQTAEMLQDDEQSIQSGCNLSFALDQISVANMKMFLRGSLSGTNVILGNQDLGKRYALRFESDNLAGPDTRVDFWKVKLTPNGAINLIDNKYQELSFTGKCLADTTNHPTSPFYTTEFRTTSTTTTTTTTTSP